MKLILTLAILFLLSGCATSGYRPHYIVSDASEEEVILPEAKISDPTCF